MGVRDRLKNRVKRILGNSPAEAVTPPPTPAAPVKKAAPAAPAAAAPAAAAPAPAAAAPAPAAPAKKSAAVLAKAKPAADAGPTKVDPEKKKLARLKAKKAVLQFLIKSGGESNMKDMHDFSERRYFIAHKAFSDLMEEYIAQDLIDFDQTTYIAVITDTGRQWVEDATDIKTREKM